MRTPTCPAHGRLVLDLALGRLDDVAAPLAEAVRSSCPDCAAWWREELGGEVAALVDAAVAGGLAGVVLGDRRRRRPWLVAAAAVAMIGTSMVLLGPRPAAIPSGDAAADSARVFSLDFEGGELPADVQAVDAEQAEVFLGDFESGGLSTWSNPA